ncbi:MAG: MFS transporter [Stappiaceae bacterium]
MTVSKSNLPPRAIVAATSGNLLEWYDFTVYGFLAPILGRLFFPSEDHVASLLSAFAVLAVGYAARPIGSVIFGHIGDRLGRKPALLSSVAIMGIGSLLIAVLPTYSSIGVSAAFLLIAIRILQGISVAGEYTSSGILMVEETEQKSRGFVGSWVAFAMLMGCVAGSGVPALLDTFLTQAQMEAWGWRIPFFIGSVVALFSAILRVYLPESSEMVNRVKRETYPIIAAIRKHWRLILQMIVLLIPTAVIYFVIFVYAASYLTTQMHFTSAQALNITTINLIVIAAVALIAGRASDHFGRRAVFLVGAIGTLVFAGPCWWLMHQETIQLVFLGQLGFSAFNAIGWALSITVLCEMAPPSLRCSVVALGYNSCMAIFGGTTPFVATYLVNRTGNDFAPVYYVLLATIASLFVIMRLPALKHPSWSRDA